MNNLKSKDLSRNWKILEGINFNIRNGTSVISIYIPPKKDWMMLPICLMKKLERLQMLKTKSIDFQFKLVLPMQEKKLKHIQDVLQMD